MEYRKSQTAKNSVGLDHECAVLDNTRWYSVQSHREEHRNTFDLDILYSLHRAIQKCVLLCPYCEGFDGAISVGKFFPLSLSEIHKENCIIPRSIYDINSSRIELSIKATMSDSAATNKISMTEATSAAQHSDNIAHALAGAGGGLLSMTLT